MEPPKKDMVSFLKHEHVGQAVLKWPPRLAMSQFLATKEADQTLFFEVTVDLGEAKISKQEHLVGRHSNIDAEYMRAIEEICLADPRIQEEIRSLDLPEHATVCVESWTYGTDGMNETGNRITMVGLTMTGT